MESMNIFHVKQNYQRNDSHHDPEDREKLLLTEAVI